MKTRMSVLFVSPTEKMRSAILQIGRSYPDIQLTVGIGNEAVGQRLVEEYYSHNFDCIISRGNTAAMIRRAVSVPVIDVKVTLYDILESLSPVTDVPARIAAVGYNSVVSGMGYLNRFLPFNMEVCGFDDISQLPQVFDELRRKDIRLIVCDTITHQLALKEGFDAYILASGADSIRYAFEQAVQLFQSNQSMLEENQLLRRLASANSESGTVVYGPDHRLYYSTLPAHDTDMLEHLRQRLPDFESHGRFRMVRQRGDFLYRIAARRLNVGGKSYDAYFISRATPNLQQKHRSIHYYTQEDVLESFHSSVFGGARLEEYYIEEAKQLVHQKKPVLIYGEIGTGKNHMAQLLYLQSGQSRNPFVVIDCSLIGKHTWRYLLSHNDSPLCDNGNTIFIKNIDAIDDDQLRGLLAAIMDSDAARRNSLIFSCSAQRSLSPVSGLPVLKVMNMLGCLTVTMRPLRGEYAMIRASVDRLLARSRRQLQLSQDILEPKAMEELLHFSWPQNYDQLIRVVDRIAAKAGGGQITYRMVEEVLSTEIFFIRGETSQTGNTMLDLGKTMEQINADIARIVLEQCHGNQTLAAKSLGISRTTLWRMLKEQADR